jgi:PAS domain S-box-containing protein
MSMVGAQSAGPSVVKDGERGAAAAWLARWIESCGAEGESGDRAEVVRAIGALLAEREEFGRRLEVSSMLLSSSPVVSFVWRVEPGYPVEYVSENVGEVLGYSAEELTSGRVQYLDLVHGADRARVERECDASVREGRGLEQSYRMRRSDGVEILVQESSRPTQKHALGGGGLRVIGFIRDMTAQQALLDQVNASRARLRALFDQVSVGMVEVGRDGLVTETNPAMTRFLGWAREELVGQPWQRISNPEDTPRCEREIAKMIASEQNYFEVDKRYLHKDGSSRWGRVSISAIRDEAGKVDRLLAVIVDMDERLRARERLHESESQLRAIFNSAPIGISLATPEGVVKIANARLLKILGREEAEVCGRHWKEFTYEADRADNERLMSEALRSGADTWTMEKRYVKPDGSIVWANLNAMLLRSESGTPMGLVATIEDITHRRQLEQELAESKRMESLGRLAGGVAHDFNNLLTAIMGYASILEKRVREAEIREIVGRISAASTSAAGLTRQLLAFARKQEVSSERVDLGESVRNACEVAKGLIGEGQRLRVKVEKGAMPVRADRSQLEQVVLNLVANAADASSAEGEIEVSVERSHPRQGTSQSGTRMAVIDVRDYGAGIDPSVLPHIFEPFFTTKPRGRGTGLGLATVYGIVKQAGGTVMVQSDPGRGSLFRVLWPLTSVESSASEESAGERRRGAGEVPLSGSVLVVEYEVLVRELVESARCDRRGVRWTGRARVKRRWH